MHRQYACMHMEGMGMDIDAFSFLTFRRFASGELFVLLRQFSRLCRWRRQRPKSLANEKRKEENSDAPLAMAKVRLATANAKLIFLLNAWQCLQHNVQHP